MEAEEGRNEKGESKNPPVLVLLTCVRAEGKGRETGR